MAPYPPPPTYKVVSPLREFGDFPMVSSLIDQEMRWWKANVIRELFLPFEKEIILKIPLSQNFSEDNLIWIWNKRGVFSVKSAYFIAANLQTDSDVRESYSRNSNAHLWRALWKLKLLPKLKFSLGEPA